MTANIRAALAHGSMSMVEIARAIDQSNTEFVQPFVWQMTYRTRELVKLPGSPPRWRLRVQHTELTAV